MKKCIIFLVFSIFLFLKATEISLAGIFLCSTPSYCPPAIPRRSWSCQDTWSKCGTGNSECVSAVTCSDDCCADGGLIVTPSPPPPSVIISPVCQLFANPNPCNINYYASTCSPNYCCSSTISWTNNVLAEITVQQDSKSEQIFAGNQTPPGNSQVASWIKCGSTYTFRCKIQGETKSSLVVRANCSSGCYQECVSGVTNCSSGLVCADANQGHGVPFFVCLNQNCPQESDCQCSNETLPPTTPTLTPTLTPIPSFTPTISPWFQTKGGDVHGNEEIKTFIPSSIYTFFSLDPAGVVSVGKIFGLLGSLKNKLSSSLWQVNHQTEEITQEKGFGEKQIIFDFYYFWEKFDSPATPDFNGSKPTNPPLNGQAYFAQGTVNILSDWEVGSGEKLIFLIDGDLYIGGKIRVKEGGFLAFIVSGDISISDNLGRASSSLEPIIEGVFIANGSIKTGRGSQKFIGQGIFVADADLDNKGKFEFERNLNLDNKNYPAEFFSYRPDFLVNFPQELGTKKIILWQEVAP